MSMQLRVVPFYGDEIVTFEATACAVQAQVVDLFGGIKVHELGRGALLVGKVMVAVETRFHHAPLRLVARKGENSAERHCHVRAFYLSTAPGVRRPTRAKSIICMSGSRTEIAQKVAIPGERDNALRTAAVPLHHLEQSTLAGSAVGIRSLGTQVMTTLTGKTALVTGASRGIGRASALALAKAGAQVLVHYATGAKEAEAVVAEIREAGGRADAVAVDLSAPDGPHKLARQVRTIVGDRLDILVANAGVSKAAAIEDYTVEDFDRLFAVNVRVPFFLVQQLLPILHEGSSITLLSSLAARAAVGALSAYGATKGAIDTLVKHFASVLGARGIRVNAVAPGVVQTDMSQFTKTDAGRDYTLGMQALKRLAEPDNIGGVVAFLASNDARWITGATIHVDGGSKL